LARGLERLGFSVRHDHFFDTIRVDIRDGRSANELLAEARRHRVNLRRFEDGSIGVALDETVNKDDINTLIRIFGGSVNGISAASLAAEIDAGYQGPLRRTSPYLEHPVFNSYHSETEMMRYLHRLASKDLSLTTSMIPLGSCTMKLNAAAELMPLRIPMISRLHPFAPPEQAAGYRILIGQLEQWLAEITGFAEVSVQPNSGATGEYTGLLVIRAYHNSRGEGHRNVCLIPE